MSKNRDDVTDSRPTECGLYVHVPFCETKCGYCDFFSVATRGRESGPLVDRVTRELHNRLDGAVYGIRTVFVGGGTPTVLMWDQLARLMSSIGRVLDGNDIDEYTVEANPATVDDKKAELLRRHGVTRVSMGAQSFITEELATLERIHKPGDTESSIRILRRNGIGQVNLDLIFGIPGQTIDTWSESLRHAVALEPDHVACYGLTYEPDTRLTVMRDAGRISPVDEQLEADMYLHAIDVLAAAGFEQYEISNFARTGCACLHNLNYWRNGPYVGVGPSAVGCTGRRRYKNRSDVDDYVRIIDQAGHAEIESETIDPATLITELIMMQLRLTEGLSIEAFKQRTGADPLSLLAEPLERLSESGKLTVSRNSIALTRSGRLIADAIIAELASAADGS